MPKSKKVATSAEAKSSAATSKSSQKVSGGAPGRSSQSPGKAVAPSSKAAGTGKSPGGPTPKPSVTPVATPGASKSPLGAPNPPGRSSSKSTAIPAPSGANGKSNGKAVVKAGGAPVASAGSKGASPTTPPAVAKGSGPKSASGTGKPSKKSAPEAPPMPAVPRKFPKGGPSKADLRKYRARLLELRRGLLSSSRDLASEALKSSGSEFPVDRAADGGSDNYEQDFSLQLLEGEAAQLADIREALLKIDGKVEHPFGVCEACTDADKRLCETCPWIPPSRLDVMPHARLCVQTKEIEERKKQR